MVVLLVKAIIIKLFKDAATDAFLKQVMRYRKIQGDANKSLIIFTITVHLPSKRGNFFSTIFL